MVAVIGDEGVDQQPAVLVNGGGAVTPGHVSVARSRAAEGESAEQRLLQERQKKLQNDIYRMNNLQDLRSEELREVLEQVAEHLPLNIFAKVNLFAKKLRARSSYFRKSTLSEREYKLIGDRSAFYRRRQHETSAAAKQFENAQRENSCVAWLSSIWDRCPVVLPESEYLSAWDVVHCLAIFMGSFYMPIEVVAQLDFLSLYGDVWEFTVYCCLTIFVVQILLQFVTGYYEKGICVKDKQKIRRKYYGSFFLQDLLTLVPFLLQVSYLNGYPYNLLNIVMLLKLTHVYKILKKHEKISLQRKNQARVYTFKLAKLIFNVVLFGHLVGLIWLGVGLLGQSQGAHNWLEIKGLSGLQKHWFERYIFSLYWSIMTMTTVGYVSLLSRGENQTLK